jgi:predicted NBD/HSP70 family sugar kinase
MKHGKATRQQIRQHNRQLLLRAVYDGLANSRAALAQATGLTKPAVSDLIAELIDEGLLEEGGRGQSTDSGGKRPRLLRFVPEARQVIGVSVDVQRVLGVLSNLDGFVIAEHYADLTDITGDNAIAVIRGVINGLVAQLDAPLLCIGIGVPGIVDVSKGVIRHSASFGWRNVPLSEILSEHYGVPVRIDNNTELAAIAHLTTIADENVQNLVMVSINQDLEIGVTLGSGTYHYGHDIGFMRIAEHRQEDLEPERWQTLQSFLGWAYVQERIRELRDRHKDCHLLTENPTYLDIRYCAAQGDPVAVALREDLAGHLARLYVWIIGLLRPDHLALTGPIVDFGQLLLDDTAVRVESMLCTELVQDVTFSLAETSHLSARGAVARSIGRELGIL